MYSGQIFLLMPAYLIYYSKIQQYYIRLHDIFGHVVFRPHNFGFMAFCPKTLETSAVGQGGPPGFDMRAILQKRENLRATSNKMMCETTDSQDLKFKREDKRLRH